MPGPLKLIAYLTLTLVCIPFQAMMLLLFGDQYVYRIPQWYHRICCKIFGITVLVEGQIEQGPGVVYISNHLSYLDIPVITSILPTSFVAKKEVAGWPLFGLLAVLQKTFFVSRARGDSAREKNLFLDRLKSPLPLMLFAEGTSSDGSKIYPFKSSLFEVFLNQNFKLQPVTISILKIDEKTPATELKRDLYAWHGDMTLMPHLINFSKVKKTVIKVTFQKSISTNCFNDRKLLSEAVYQKVQEGLDFTPPPAYGSPHTHQDKTEERQCQSAPMK